jgi:hypothetical protein
VLGKRVVKLKSQIVTSNVALQPELIERRIFLIRGQKVMLDSHLAELYGVSTKRFNEQVRRNLNRFPPDFMFRLSRAEFEALRSQFATSKTGRGGRRHRPFAFTEQGVAMLSSVLRSERAVQVNIAIMRAFVKLREMLASHAELARKLAEMEKKYDPQFKVVFDVIRQLTSPKVSPRGRIGFTTGKTEHP